MVAMVQVGGSRKNSADRYGGSAKYFPEGVGAAKGSAGGPGGGYRGETKPGKLPLGCRSGRVKPGS
jgi:hypothetical protein